MNRLGYMFLEMMAPVFLMPIVVAFYGRKKAYAVRRTLLCLLLSMYLASVFHLTGQPDLIYHRFEPNIYLIPFGDIRCDWKNALLNVLLFVPLGFLLPTLEEKYQNAGKTVRFGFCMTFAVEVLQMFTLRATDINDVITNVCGTALGWLLWRGVRNTGLLKGIDGGSGDVVFCGLSTYCVMFFIQPFVYRMLWILLYG